MHPRHHHFDQRTVAPSLPAQAAVDAGADAAADNGDRDDDASHACGWYDSSFALRAGLQVSELADSDGSVAALWFPGLVQ